MISIPLEFAETRLDEINSIVPKFLLANIVVVTDQGRVASHLPVIVDKLMDAVDAKSGTDLWTGRFSGR